MKKNITLILWVMLLLLSSCKTDIDKLEKETYVMPKEKNISTTSVEIGMSYHDLYAKHSDHLIVNCFSCLVWKNDDGSCDVTIFRDGTVSAIAHFSPGFEDAEFQGLSPIMVTDPKNLVGKTETELTFEYGLPHFDAGSGRYIPTYIEKTGKLFFLTILERDIVNSISELDLTTETSRIIKAQ